MKKILLIFSILVFSLSVAAQTTNIKIFVGNSRLNPNSEDCSKVFAIQRTITETKAVANAALSQLFKGVTDEEKGKDFYSPFSEESRDILIGVNVEKGAAYVNFKESVKQAVNGASTSCGSEEFFAEIENTLKQFPTVKKVFYAIEGNPSDFYDWMQIGELPKELKNCNGRKFPQKN